MGIRGWASKYLKYIGICTFSALGLVKAVADVDGILLWWRKREKARSDGLNVLLMIEPNQEGFVRIMWPCLLDFCLSGNLFHAQLCAGFGKFDFFHKAEFTRFAIDEYGAHNLAVHPSHGGFVDGC